MKRILVLVVAAFLTGCSPEKMIEKFADDAKEHIALDYIQRVVSGDLVALTTELDPAVPSTNALAALEQLRANIPKETPTVTNLVGYNVSYSSSEGTQNNLIYQLGYDGKKWLLVYVTWSELPGGKRQIVTLKAQSLQQSLQEANRFSFRHAGALHFLFLGAATLVSLFILTTLVVCIKTKLPRRKWMWILFILVGVVPFSINWTTGEVGFNLLSILFFGASGMAASPYSPWIISFAIPIGAILFWFRRAKLMGPVVPPLPPMSSPKDLDENQGRTGNINHN
ncbi:hypothetical protein [Rariglobus hedericola]|uniref:Uncharacterized protein n=1 Tax=Rariglobus hedericola TaxID=2597822 RepID=A0A556QPC5_9BACT|nr:hypothetical protein [Rariglobus hedericola]TSJ78498.1 hypothetical protein FPL22_04140 [Rariglobus hedericola]